MKISHDKGLTHSVVGPTPSLESGITALSASILLPPGQDIHSIVIVRAGGVLLWLVKCNCLVQQQSMGCQLESPSHLRNLATHTGFNFLTKLLAWCYKLFIIRISSIIIMLVNLIRGRHVLYQLLVQMRNYFESDISRLFDC